MVGACAGPPALSDLLRKIHRWLLLPVVLGLLWWIGRPLAGRAVDLLVWAGHQDVPTIDTATLATKLRGKDPPLLLDVRTAAEFAVSHLPHAIHVEPDADPVAAVADLPKGRLIVTYCSVGWRSAEHAARLQAAGRRVRNLVGSAFRWVNEGRPLQDAEGGKVTVVHPFNEVWGYLVEPARRADY